MKAYWSQIATAFADYDNRLLFAAANEPNPDTAGKRSELLAYYKTFARAVRTAGGYNSTRWLVLQGPVELFNSWPVDTYYGFPRKYKVAQNHLMYEAHCYTPSLFTIIHDDPSWGKSIYFWGQGYHSSIDTARNASWGEEAAIDAEMQTIYDKFVNKGIPVLLGEFGAFPTPGLTGTAKALNNAATTYWNKYVQEAARSRGISPFFWSTPGSIFDWSTGAVSDSSVLNSVSAVGTSLAPPDGDGAQMCFELSVQSWAASGAPIGAVARSTAKAYAGSGCLAMNFTGTTAGTAVAFVSGPAIPSGKKITFRLWVPSGHKLAWVQPYAADRKWAWTAHWYSGQALVGNAWNTLTVNLPDDLPTPLQQVGVQFSTSDAWIGTCYLDSVAW